MGNLHLFASGPIIPDSLDGGDFVPISTLLLHPDTVMVLVEQTPSYILDFKKRMLLLKLVVDEPLFPLPQTIAVVKPGLEHPVHEVRGTRHEGYQ